MGYTLHITRKPGWTEASGPTISEAEWRSAIEADPELELDAQTRVTMSQGEYVFAAWKGRGGALGYFAGEITADNPDKPLIRKMVQVANALHASVQGDDGELYREDASSYERELGTAASPPGLISRIRGWFRHRRVVRELHQSTPRFRKGQRVKNPWGQKGTLIEVDPKANGGLGSVRVRFDNGSEQQFAYVASALEIIDEKPPGKP